MIICVRIICLRFLVCVLNDCIHMLVLLTDYVLDFSRLLFWYFVYFVGMR